MTLTDDLPPRRRCATTMKSCVHLLSGGLDSTVLLYDLRSQRVKVQCLLVDYGQRHETELDYAKHHCHELDVEFTIAVIPTLGGSKLTEGGESWVVPFRNPVMLGLGVNLAYSLGYEAVTIACNADDETDFPDCRWAVMDAMNHAIKLSGLSVAIHAPYLRMTKRQVVEKGRKLDVPFGETWSCYLGGKTPCGKCPACLKREDAIKA